eukprot:SAG11_NODE_16250_length_553_cov_0.810573_2_plen_34_part_01
MQRLRFRVDPHTGWVDEICATTGAAAAAAAAARA